MAKRPPVNELILDFLPLAESVACKMLADHPEFKYHGDDLKAEAAVKLVETLQPECLEWDESLTKSENCRKINTFIRIAIRNHCIDITRRERLCGERFQPRNDIDFLAIWTDGVVDTEIQDLLTTEESVVLDLFFQELTIAEIQERTGWDTKKQVTNTLEAIATKIEAAR